MVLNGNQHYVDVSKLNFQKEAENLWQISNQQMSQNTLTLSEFQQIKAMVSHSLKELIIIQKKMQPLLQAKRKLKYYRKQMGISQKIQGEEYIQAFVKWKQIHSRARASESDIRKAYQTIESAKESTVLIPALKQSLQLIMQIRNIYKTPIYYATTIYDQVNGQDNLWFSAHSSIESLLSENTLHVSSEGNLQLIQTSQELKNSIYNMEKQNQNNKYINLLDTPESKQLWNLLKQIRDTIPKKVNSFSYGQLLESFVYLSQQQKFNPSEGEIWQALLQGRNRISFEVEGDFRVIDQEFNTAMDIQSKLFNTLGKDDAQHRVTLISLSGAIRVLTNIKNAIGRKTNVNNINKALSQVFESQQGRTTVLKGEAKIKEIISRIVNEKL